MTLEHLSFSQYSSYTRCARSWYLGKVRQAEEKQTWYIPVGTAFHQMIEHHLDPLVDLGDPEDYFYPLIEAQMKIEPDTTTWLSGGSKDDPCVEGKALQLLRDCFEKALIWLEDFEVWDVEYEATGILPGCPVPIKAFVDVIGEHKKHGPSIVDWKTGKNKPKDNFQLETYKALLMVNSDPRFKVSSILIDGTYMPLNFKGLWGMVNPLASSPRPIDLSQVDPKIVGAKYRDVYHQMQARMYRANQGYDCLFCFHQENCLANMTLPTKRALYYDRSSRDTPPY